MQQESFLQAEMATILEIDTSRLVMKTLHCYNDHVKHTLFCLRLLVYVVLFGYVHAGGWVICIMLLDVIYWVLFFIEFNFKVCIMPIDIV